jgi:hypothetical protein
MLNGMIDSGSCGSSHSRCRHTEQEISQEMLEQRMRVQEEYNAQMHDYFASYATQQQEMFITNMLHLQTWAQQQGQTILFPQWQPPPPPQFPPIHPTGSASTVV